MKLLAQMQAPWLGSMESGAEGAGWGGVLCPGCLVTGYTHSPREPALESPPSHRSLISTSETLPWGRPWQVEGWAPDSWLPLPLISEGRKKDGWSQHSRDGRLKSAMEAEMPQPQTRLDHTPLSNPSPQHLCPPAHLGFPDLLEQI